MNKKKTLLLIALIIVSHTLVAQTIYPFLDPNKSVEERAENIVSLLTLDEKISQMMNSAPAIERLGIPGYNWWNECLHGVARSPYRVTSFPQAIGMAATWDTASLLQMAQYASDEGRAIYNDASSKSKTGIYLGLTFWSPNVNIFRDPRWGRGQETYGEDPFLTSQLGMSFVRGLEGDHPHYLKTSACAKHYAVHSGPEWNRSTFNAEVSDQDLWDTYLPAFKKLIVDAKVSGVMCAYNAFYGQPCCGNNQLMMDILRNQWGFTGYVTSDCGGINHFHQTHKTHPNKQAAAADAVLHGTDCECSNNGSYNALNLAVAEGLITEEEINTSLRRLFEIRLRLGMFDPADRVPYSTITTDVLECQPHQEHALKMAQQSIVLLKNENKTLPLSKKIKKVALVGPNAVGETVMLGNYYGYPTKVWSIMEGLRQKLGPKTEIIYEPGCGYTDTQVFRSEYNPEQFSHNGKTGLQAEYFNNPHFKNVPVAVQMESKIDFQHGDGEMFTSGIAANQMSIRFTTEYRPDKTGQVSFYLSGDDGYKLYIDGKLCINSTQGQKYYTFDVQKGKPCQVIIEYWQYTDVSELRFDVGHLWNADPRETAQAVKDADVIIFAGGISASLEGEAMKVFAEGFKGGDRETIALPRVQTALLKELAATGKPVVFVMLTGSAIAVEWEAENLPAILNAWYPGQAGGRAIADVLFGDYNPAGRLPVTFYKTERDLPDFEDYNMEGRTYRYFHGQERYPFGYGLSYSTFEYNGLNVIKTNNGYQVDITVTNNSKIAGDEVTQLYVANKNEKFRTPIRSLKGFQRIHLKAGESRKLTFTLPAEELTVVDIYGNSQPMTGDIEIAVGGGQPGKKAPYQSTTVKSMVCVEEELHPSIFLNSNRVEELKAQNDEVSLRLKEIIIQNADEAIGLPPVVYASNPFLFGSMRETQRRVLYLSMSYLLTGKDEYFQAARQVLMKLTALDDWGTNHFLDVGEATLAAGVGLDWLYSKLTIQERETIARAIADKGLRPALTQRGSEDDSSWVNGTFNWNPVCHGGTMVGALAIAAYEPQLSQDIIRRAIKNIPIYANAFVPDGSEAEGPSYWSYGASFYVIAIEALRTATGSAHGLDTYKGFMKSSDYNIQMVGPTGLDFNYSDHHVEKLNEPIMLWFGRELNRYDLVEKELKDLNRVSKFNRHVSLELIWWNPSLLQEEKSVASLHYTARGGLPLGITRSSWNDPRASFIAIKGGTPNHSHGHMDVGSFVLEANGVRWAIDLGTENYNKMRSAKLDIWNYSQNSSRWTTFRVGPEAHNILRFDDAYQITNGYGTIQSLTCADGSKGHRMDITSVYADKATAVHRSVLLHSDGSMSITDEWTPTAEVKTVAFQWLTKAKIAKTKEGLLLRQNGESLRLTIESHSLSEVKIDIEDVSKAKNMQDSPNPELKRIVIKVPAGDKAGRLCVKAIAK